MKTHTYICDVCGNVIMEGRTTLTVECGPVRSAGLESLDFCAECGARFLDLVRSGARPVPDTQLVANP